MGYSCDQSDGPIIYLNTTKSYQFGWYLDAYQDIALTAASNNDYDRLLYDIYNFIIGRNARVVGAKINNLASSTDYLINFNWTSCIDSGNVKDKNTTLFAVYGGTTSYSHCVLWDFLDGL